MKTRFAPSPTGYLHLGHLWSAACVWSEAAKRNAPVHLRIEDHDPSRCTEEFVQAITSDLAHFGFVWQSQSRQSERGAIYQKYYDELLSKGLLYACNCHRKDPECHCKNLPFEGNKIRLILPTQKAVVVRDREGNWTYPFCVAVDDHLEGIDLIVRGEDLRDMEQTQNEISALLGRKDMPLYIHHSLLYGADGKKLSKRDGAARALAYDIEKPGVLGRLLRDLGGRVQGRFAVGELGEHDSDFFQFGA
jgi:glutamyl-tRNA synthetase/glutamyl-Q tRNA(Asp) synthetase